MRVYRVLWKSVLWWTTEIMFWEFFNFVSSADSDIKLHLNINFVSIETSYFDWYRLVNMVLFTGAKPYPSAVKAVHWCIISLTSLVLLPGCFLSVGCCSLHTSKWGEEEKVAFSLRALHKHASFTALATMQSLVIWTFHAPHFSKLKVVNLWSSNGQAFINTWKIIEI